MTDQPNSGTETLTHDTQKHPSETAASSLSVPQLLADRYELRGVLAKGGMGVVHTALDHVLNRTVAVKMLLDKVTSELMIRRFDYEANITAQLQHPSIPPIHDRGTLPNGKPFLVMKLIKGVTLDQLLKSTAEPLSVLGIFESIAQAIGYAHAHGVIHRDLKPLNIMVGAFGEVQVMDWGLAKVLAAQGRTAPDSDETDYDPNATQPLGTQFNVNVNDTDRTQYGEIRGTPSFMPPEQAIGAIDDVSERSDVFGLGGILCAMLTGKPVFIGENAESTRQLAAKGKLADAFTRLDACGAEPEVIALAKRCLAVEPSERPANGYDVARQAAKLQADAEERAKLAEMEKARSEVRSQEQRRRRHLVSIAAGVVATILTLGIVGTTWGLLQANAKRQEADASSLAARAAERDADEKRRDAEMARQREAAERANAEAKEAEATAEKRRAIAFRDKALEGLRAATNEDARKLIGSKEVLGDDEKAYLNAISLRWELFAREVGSDEQSRVLAAEGHFQMAYILSELGRNQEAELRYAKAAAIREQLVADYPNVPQYRAELATTFNNLAGLLQVFQQYSQSSELHTKALALRRSLMAEFPKTPSYRANVALSHNNLSIVLRWMRKLREAADHHRQALAIREQLAADFPREPAYRSDLAISHQRFGSLLADMNQPQQAEEQYRKALVIQELSYAEQMLKSWSQTELNVSKELADTHSAFARMLDGQNRVADAEDQYRKAIAIREKLAAEYPTLATHRFSFASITNDFAGFLARHGKRAEALERYRQSIASGEKLLAASPERIKNRTGLADSYVALGNFLWDSANRPDAEEPYRKALAIQDKLVAEVPNNLSYRSTAGLLNLRLATLMSELNQPSEVPSHLRKALALQAKLVADSPTTIQYRIELSQSQAFAAWMLLVQGKRTECVAEYTRAIDALKLNDMDLRSNAIAIGILKDQLTRRAQVLSELNHHRDAIADYTRLIELCEAQEQITLRFLRASSMVRVGQVTEALAEATQLAKLPNTTLDDHYNLACLWALLASAASEQRAEYAERAMACLRRALQQGLMDVDHIKQDLDLDALRSRHDFQQLIADLEIQAAPKRRELAPTPRIAKP
jgi:serine/threonine protein kinase